jgi:Contractile injection system tube protein/LysM domain
MALEKATITPKDGDPIPVLFNPTQYSLDKGNQIAEIGIPGLGSPILQYVRGGPRSLGLDLFFDTYEARSNVCAHTDRIYKLLEITAKDHVPPVCRFAWGAFHFDCIVERVSGKFTLFLANGTPVRATLTVSLKEFIKVDVEVKNPPTESVDRTKSRTIKRGDSLSSLAAVEYGDPGMWRPIAEANGIDNPRRIAPGTVLVVPPL